MVMKGQFLERPTLIPVGGVALEGLWHRGQRAPPLLIVPPLPEEGGMDDVIADELAWAVARAQHATLRFNFRGVGASQGERGGLDAQCEDAEAALATLLESAASASAAVVGVRGSSQVVLALQRRKAREIAGVFFVDPKEETGELGPVLSASDLKNLPLAGRTVVSWVDALAVTKPRVG